MKIHHRLKKKLTTRHYFFLHFVISATHSFPYVKKRIDIIERKDLELSPIEVAIDQMQTKVAEMREVVNMSHPDLKRLQLKLQGSVSAQVRM